MLMNKKTMIVVAAGVLAVALVVGSVASKGKSRAQAETNVAHVGQKVVVPAGSLEIPTYTRARAHSQQIEHKAYTVDYNEEWRLANWVAYSLTADQTKGPVERYNKFDADPQVKGATAQWWSREHTGS